MGLGLGGSDVAALAVVISPAPWPELGEKEGRSWRRRKRRDGIGLEMGHIYI